MTKDYLFSVWSLSPRHKWEQYTKKISLTDEQIQEIATCDNPIRLFTEWDILPKGFLPGQECDGFIDRLSLMEVKA